MKKIGLVSCLLLLTALPLWADHVDPETARKVATTFLSNNGAKVDQLIDLSKSVGFPNLYIFSADHGYVVMSADDCAKPILGYSFSNNFESQNLPENLKSWLLGYSKEIQYAIDNQLTVSPKISKEWKDLIENRSNVSKTSSVIGPLIQTRWGQRSPYYDLCPSNQDGQTVTGCVATAMAQVLKYNNYPARGIGSHSYKYSPYGTITADFGATTYDWVNMTNTYSSASTPDQKSAVATLMYHCGVSVEMQYGTDESGSNNKRASIAMRTYFNLNTSYLEKSDYSEEEWSDTLKYELNHTRPILYSGYGQQSGHSFVCDGYDDMGAFHFNWGWNGSNDGYFRLTSTNFQYSTGQAAVISIYPLSDNTTPISLEINNKTLTWTDSENCDSYRVYRNNALIATTTESTYTDAQPFFGLNKYYVRGVKDAVLTLPSNYSNITVDFPTPIVNSLHTELSENNLILSWNAPDWCFPSTADAESFAYLDEERQSNNDSHYIWDEGDFIISWGHRYPAEILKNYNGKAIHEISFFSMYPGAFDVVVYQGTEEGHPATEIARKSITTARMGWSKVGFQEPAIIDGSKDLWVFVINTDCKVHIVYNNYISGNTEGGYVSNDDPSQVCYHDPDENIVWFICAYLTDGTYTYNLYDGNTKVNGDVPIPNTCYNISGPLGDGLHPFTVKTKHNSGESDASNKASVAIGEVSLNNLTLEEDMITVAPSSTLTLNGTVSNDSPANLIIEDGGQLIHPASAVKATLKKAVSGFGEDLSVKTGWYTIASPVADALTDLATDGTYDLYAYDEPSRYWKNQKIEANDITTFSEGHGLLYANANDNSLVFAGDMKATGSNISLPLRYTEHEDGLAGFNLIGNPFSCNINSGDIYFNDTALTVYYSVENGENITAHHIGVDPIKPGQGFFVQATGKGQNIEFHPTTSSKGDNDSYRPAFISIKAGNDNFMDCVIIQIGGGNTLRKMRINDNVPQLYVMHDGKDYAAATISEAQGEIPVHFKATQNGTYTLTLSGALDSRLSTLNHNYLHLIDNLTGADIDLLVTPSYTFEARTDDYPSRFRLLMKSTDEDQVEMDGTLEGDTQIIDMTGRIVATDRNAQLTPGIYILRTINGNDTKTEKIRVK